MEITKKMLIAEFARQIDFAKFVESKQTSPFRTEFLEYALTLIRELTEENEKLKKSYRLAVQDNADTCQLLFKAEDEIKEIRAKTVREMAERLKARKVSYGNITFKVVPIDDVDQIAQEMIGETK